MIFDFDAYIPGFRDALPFLAGLDTPWNFTRRLADLLKGEIVRMDRTGYHLDAAGICIHHRAIVEPGAVIKPPALMEDAFIGAHACLRGGTLIGVGACIGPGCEVKSSLVGDGSSIGANAVLSPGTLLPPGSVVGRLQLVPPADT